MTNEQLNSIARDMYMQHWAVESLPNNRMPPVWENTSEELKEFVRLQVLSTIKAYEDLRIQFPNLIPEREN